MAHPIDVARDSLDAFNAGDFEKLRALHTADYVEDEFATGRRFDSLDEAMEAARGWRRSFPDAKGTVVGAYGDDRTAVLEIRWEGTNEGPMPTPDGGELPPSGRQVSVRACQVFEIRDGLIGSSRHYFDLLTLLEQIGVEAAEEARTAR